MKMIGNWEIAHLSPSERYMLYADAYLQASRSLSLRMREEEAERTWPNASVAMMLAAHSVELFLKGAVISRAPENLARIPIRDQHRIDRLADTYFETFPEPEFAFDVPFQGEYPGFSEDEIALLKKDEPIPSILFRYPVRAPDVEWIGVHGFEPQGFLEALVDLRESYARIRERI